MSNSLMLRLDQFLLLKKKEKTCLLHVNAISEIIRKTNVGFSDFSFLFNDVTCL